MIYIEIYAFSVTNFTYRRICGPFEVDIIVAPTYVQLELFDLQESEEFIKGKIFVSFIVGLYKYLEDFHSPGLCKDA